MKTIKNLFAKVKDVPYYARGSWAIIKRAPIRVRVVTIIFVAYMVSPLDIIPDFIPGLGMLDDIIVISLFGKYVNKNLPELAEFLKAPIVRSA